MNFDVELVLICVVAALSGLLFYVLASRDPKSEASQDSSVCERR